MLFLNPYLLNIFFIFFRAWFYCKACHEEIKDETLIKKCKCKNCEYHNLYLFLIISIRSTVFKAKYRLLKRVLKGFQMHSNLIFEIKQFYWSTKALKKRTVISEYKWKNIYCYAIISFSMALFNRRALYNQKYFPGFGTMASSILEFKKEKDVKI